MVKVLFLAANPHDSVRLRLDAEIREIDDALRKVEFREEFEIVQHGAVRTTDIQGLLLRHKPHIVHFSGHGTDEGEIILEDSSAASRPVPLQALEQLFSALGHDIKCVVLNACYSEVQAKAIAKHVPYVVGMANAIDDQAAIAFATAFYQALGYGKDIQTAYQLGCVQIVLSGLAGYETPQLVALRGSQGSITLAGPRAPDPRAAAYEATVVKRRTGVEVYCQKPWSRLGQSPNCAILSLESGLEMKRKLMWEAFVFVPLEPNQNYRLTISRPWDPFSFKAKIVLSVAPGTVKRYVYESPPISFMAGEIKPTTGTGIDHKLTG